MAKTQDRVSRQGRIYRFTIGDQDYAAFIWQVGLLFYGRIDGNPSAPQLKGSSALGVRDALRDWLVGAKEA